MLPVLRRASIGRGADLVATMGGNFRIVLWTILRNWHWPMAGTVRFPLRVCPRCRWRWNDSISGVLRSSVSTSVRSVARPWRMPGAERPEIGLQ
jgi:hypothetical protein